MKTSNLLIVMALTFLLLGTKAYPQFTNYTSKDGLSFNNVEHISEDDEGLIYVATFDGLNVFNGTDFKIYNPNNTEGFSLKISCTLPIKQGFVLIGTMDRGLFLMDKYNQRILPLKLSSSSSTSSTSITSMFMDSKHMVWLGLGNGSIITFNRSDITQDNTISDINSIEVTNTANTIKSFAELDGFIFSAGNGSRITRIKKDSKNYIIDQPLDLINCHQVYDMKVINKALFIGTDKGLYKVDHLQNLQQNLSLKMPWRLSNTIVRSLSVHNKDLWIGTEGDGLFKFSEFGEELEHYFYSDNKRNALNSNYALCTLIDSNENLWVGTWYGGINLLSLHKKSIQSVYDSESEVNLFSNIIWTITEGPNNDYYLGTHGKGLCSYSLPDKNFKSISTDKDLKSISSLYYDKQTQLLYLGTWGQGVKIYDPIKQKLVNNKFDLQFLDESRIYSIVRGNDDNLWFGSFSEGLFKYSKNRNELERFSLTDDTFSSTLDIRSLLMDYEKNQLWVGSINHGLFRIQFFKNNAAPKIDHFSTFSNSNEKISVQNLFMDSDHKLWILCRDGMGHFDKTDGPQKSPILKDIVITGMAEDSAKNFWISTYKGISLLKRDTQEITSLIQNDTYSSVLYNPEKNMLLLASNHGLLLSPTHIEEKEKTLPKLIFSDLKIMDRKISPHESIEDHIVLKKKLNYSDTIVLPHFAQTFSLGINAIYFGENAKEPFRYRLKNFENSWNLSNNLATVVSYTNVPPGTYDLEVQTLNTSNEWSQNIRNLTIIKKKAWWFTNLAYAIYTLSLLCVFYWVAKEVKDRYKTKQELKLEKIKHERDYDLYQQKISFFTNISHDIRTPLTLILGPIEEILSNHAVEKEVEVKLQRMLKNARMLLNLVNQILDFRKAETGHIDMKIKQIQLNSFIQNIYYQFKESANNKEIDFDISIPEEDIILIADPYKLESILFNLLSNALKFTPRYRHVMILVAATDEFITIQVEDSGIGIQQSELDSIFTRFYQSKSSTGIQGTGIGMALVKKYVELHQGTITVKSTENIGSVFTIQFPIHQKSVDFEAFEPSLNLEIINPIAIDTAEIVQKKLSVLIVDDNPDILEYLKEILETDYRVLSATNGNDGQAIVNKKTPNIVISDIMMEGMNGIELCENIKTNINTSHIPVILLTAKNSTESKIEGYEKGADLYLEKPFNSKLLLTMVKKLIQHRETLKKKFLISTSVRDETASKSVDDLFIENIVTYIHDKISEPDFSIHSLAEKHHITTDQLYRKIKALTGLSTNHFIRLIRLKFAADLLAQKKYTIGEVVFMSGFNNASYFSRCFKNEFGVSPSDYEVSKNK
ncbi:hybrid sensor histidine kinase/response regulator transcription factor [Gelidibacter mesophilus]|uniref:hybrid sensor histidine kinase/response regulator transcription factor n=1 Tax=Gelidibacter mesophilus TaxID=169050 RepID=UPI0004196920|nr:ATP-binding protein [Gelidibacter mesophilus]